MKTGYVSIIVPVYNVEKYIGRCIESILNQTYPYIELIIVNDGSSDFSHYVIVDLIQKRKSSIEIKYIKQENAGVSAARNVGLSEASGEYIFFADSDDYIEKKCMEELINVLEQYNSQLVCFSCSKRCKQSDDNIIYQLNKKESINAVLDMKVMGGYCWNKLFLNRVIKKYQIKFNEELKYMEDLEFVVRYLTHVKETIYLDYNKFYYYIVREDSACGSKKYDVYKGILKSIESIIKNIKGYISDDNLDELINRYANAGVWLNMYMFREAKYLKQEIIYNLDCAKKYYHYLDMKNKLAYWVIRIAPKVVYSICRVLF